MIESNFVQHATGCQRVRGFTLIEVLITVAIIGILTAIAYPQYGSYLQDSRRADGHLALFEEVQSIERCKSTRYSYANCNLSKTRSPEDLYDMSLESTAGTFTITATAKGKQVNDTECKVMTINHLGVRSPDPASTSCWPN